MPLIFKILPGACQETSLTFTVVTLLPEYTFKKYYTFFIKCTFIHFIRELFSLLLIFVLIENFAGSLRSPYEQ